MSELHCEISVTIKPKIKVPAKCRFFNSRDVETNIYSKPFNLSQNDATKLRKSMQPLLEKLENMIEKMFPENAKHLKGTETNKCRLLKGGTLSAFTIAREFFCQPHKDTRDVQNGLSVVVKLTKENAYQYHILPDLKPKGHLGT